MSLLTRKLIEVYCPGDTLKGWLGSILLKDLWD